MLSSVGVAALGCMSLMSRCYFSTIHSYLVCTYDLHSLALGDDSDDGDGGDG
jgi:hypothetical protein